MSHLTMTMSRATRRSPIRGRNDKPVQAEQMLRDIAFVLEMTRRVKDQTVAGRLAALS